MASRESPPRARAFTLPEIMIGASLGSIVLAGVLSSFIMMARSGALLQNYSDMTTQGRRALEEFSQDIRMASDITWNSSSSVTLTIPENYTSYGNQVTYAYESGTSGTTARAFFRRPGDAASTASATVLVKNVIACTFYRFDRLDNAATTDSSTKRLELSLRMRTGGTGSATATENTVSASYLMRNKLAN